MKEAQAPLPRKISPTAANATNPLYGPSGVMRYAVVLAMQGGARQGTVVEAATGDEAAAMASAKYPGWKVAYVGPATDAIPNLSDEVA
jgi:hypothetical protein